jgi:hypothetical protein
MMILIGFGVAAYSNMYPSNGFSFKFVKMIATISYWPMYGEMGILSYINNEDDECKNDSTKCAEFEGTVFTFILLVVFMAFANVLLMNILIAMFK